MRYLIPLLVLCITGCSMLDARGRPTLQQGESKETQAIKQKENLDAQVLVKTLPTDRPGPISVMDFFGHELKVPSNSEVQVTVNSDFKKQQTDWYELVGTFNYKSGMGQLIFIGALCIAGGAVLCYFGMWSIGIGLAIFGFLLIGCGIAIERYPWVFPLVLFAGLIAVVAFVIYTIKGKNATTIALDTKAVLAEVVAKIETLKKVNPELVKTYITDELKKSDISSKVKAVVSKVKGE